MPACTPRYQSDEVDLTSGRLARRGNRRLRQALLLAADTLIRCNDHFRVLAAKWTAQGRDPRGVLCWFSVNETNGVALQASQWKQTLWMDLSLLGQSREAVGRHRAALSGLGP